MGIVGVSSTATRRRFRGFLRGAAEQGTHIVNASNRGCCSMTSTGVGSFSFLQEFWPDLAELGRKAEQVDGHEPELVAIRLRGLTEAMAVHLIRHLGLPYDPNEAHFDRLIRIENADLLDARLLAKFHAIRKLGNNAAHNRTVSNQQAAALLEDAWSLACWFCRFARPDIQWFTPARQAAAICEPSPEASGSERQSTASVEKSNVLRFPEERIQRIREEVARAMAQVDPRIRQLRTRITLHEAFTENLSDDQSACLDRLGAFLSDPEQRVFLLKGYAGTGKTFLAKGITEFLAAQGRAFRLAAPTGRAAKIISEKTRRDARTVHSQIYNFADLREYAVGDGELGSETFKFYAEIVKNQDQANAVYIIDEASLLSDVYSESEFFRSGTGYLLRDLISFVGFGHGETDRKIIFVGDPAQLPPVGMSASPALDSKYLSQYFGINAVEYELKEVLRQKADSGVIRNVMPLRESLSTGSFSSLRFAFDDDVHRLRSDDVLPRYMESRATAGPTAPIVITRSNKEAASFNRSIRDALFPGSEFVVPGDRLIVVANSLVDQVFLANGEFVDVVEAGPTVERRTVTLRQRNASSGSVDLVEVPLLFRDIRLAVTSSDGREMVLATKILDDLLHGDSADLDAIEQRALYVDFLKRHPELKKGHDRTRISQILRQDPYFNALRVRFGYAVTCHKAQGGEWEHVFVSCPQAKDARFADYFRWLYTAMTRSSSKLYLVDPPHVRIAIAGATVQAESRADPMISTLDDFRAVMLNRVREAISGTDIEIHDVAHHQYQEAFYFGRGTETARVNISYNGKFAITSVAVPPGGALDHELDDLLRPLVWQFGSSPARNPEGAGSAGSGVPSRPFLQAFHDRLLPLFDAKDIKVSDLKEQAWSQRYTFERHSETAVVDIFYDSKERITKCMPSPGKRFNVTGGKLLPEVLQILIDEITP